MQGESSIKKKVSTSMINVEITAIDLQRTEYVWQAYSGAERVTSGVPSDITVQIKLRGETIKTSGEARLTDEERARLLELTTAIEERLMREFGG
jgi:hypothetical protein